MSLKESDVVGGIAENPAGRPHLLILDDGTWTDDDKRWMSLLVKLRSYIGFICGDGFAAKFPGVEPKEVTIEVICDQPPSERMAQFTSFAPAGDETNRISPSYTVKS